MKYVCKLLVALFLLSGCLAQKKISSILQSANQFYYEKEYRKALENYNRVLDYYQGKGLTPSGEIFSSTGKCLYYLNDKAGAMDFFEKAFNNNYEDEQTAFIAVEYYEEFSDDIDKQISSLEHYAENFSFGNEIDYVRIKLFEKYYEKGDFRKAFYAYNNLPEEKSDNIELLEKYFYSAQQIGSQKKTAEIAEKLYNLDPNNLIGLSFMADKTLLEVETLFKEAQEVYNSKKNNATLKVFRKKQEDLKSRYILAKAYYTRLYNLYKRSSDAESLALICQRLGEKKNAEYYTKLSKKK